MAINLYASVDELKARLNITSTDASRDASLQTILDAAASGIDRYCLRPDGFVALATPTARTFNGSGKPVQRIDDCVEITQVAVKDSPTDDDYTAWDSMDWVAFHGPTHKPNFNGLPYTALMVTINGDYSTFTSGQVGNHKNGWGLTTNTVQVTARWGYADSCPPLITEATILQAARWWKRAQSSWADTLANSDMGQLMYRQTVDPDLRQMLDNGRFVRQMVG